MDQHLKVFVKVVETQSFSKAADALFMTQPAVSQYIRTFEENFGVRLLERTSKYVRLNEAGEIVYHHAKEIIALYKSMDNLVDDLIHRASGTISIGASFTFGEYILPRIIARMHQKFPDIKPTVTIGNTVDIADYVTRHQLDIGIVEGHFQTNQSMRVEAFAEDYMILVASPNHPLFNETTLSVKALEQYPWILREIGSGTREATDTFFQKHNISPKHSMSFGSTQAVKEAVSSDLGITFLSEWAVKKELQYGDLKMIDVQEKPFTRQFSIVTASSFQSKAQQVFIELLKDN